MGGARLLGAPPADLPCRREARNDDRGGRTISAQPPVPMLYSEIEASSVSQLTMGRRRRLRSDVVMVCEPAIRLRAGRGGYTALSNSSIVSP